MILTAFFVVFLISHAKIVGIFVDVFARERVNVKKSEREEICENNGDGEREEKEERREGKGHILIGEDEIVFRYIS